MTFDSVDVSINRITSIGFYSINVQHIKGIDQANPAIGQHINGIIHANPAICKHIKGINLANGDIDVF